MTDGDYRTLLNRLLDLEQAVKRRDPVPRPGAKAEVLRTSAVSGYTYPTAASSAYAVQRVKVTGVEAEGAAVGLAAVGPTFFALNAGGSVPPLGTNVLGTLTESGRWVFVY